MTIIAIKDNGEKELDDVDVDMGADLAESPSAEKLEDLVLVVEGGVEHLVLHQLVVAIAVRSPPSLPPAARLADEQTPWGRMCDQEMDKQE